MASLSRKKSGNVVCFRDDKSSNFFAKKPKNWSPGYSESSTQVPNSTADFEEIDDFEGMEVLQENRITENQNFSQKSTFEKSENQNEVLKDLPETSPKERQDAMSFKCSLKVLNGKTVSPKFDQNFKKVEETQNQNLQKMEVVENETAEIELPKFEFEEYPDGPMKYKIAELFAGTLPEFERQRPGYFRNGVIRDTEHQFLALYNENDEDEILGALCFSEQQPLNVVELHYFAVSTKYHRKGLGRKLMNLWKEVIADRGFHFIVTYADNTAIDFYFKQNFKKRSEMILPHHVVSKRVDRCLNAVLMECNIQDHPFQQPPIDHCHRILKILQKDLDSRNDVVVKQQIHSHKFKECGWRESKVREVNLTTCWVKCHNGWYHMNSYRINLGPRYLIRIGDPDPEPLPFVPEKEPRRKPQRRRGGKNFIAENTRRRLADQVKI